MKKKIILFLSFLLMAMFLTGCATTKTTANELKKLDDIANEIASTGPGYILPDGYELAYPNSKDTSRISITCTTEQKYMLTAEYVITSKVAQLDSYTIQDPGAIEEEGIYILFIIGLILGFVLGIIFIITN